jgi:hypothetical protein
MPEKADQHDPDSHASYYRLVVRGELSDRFAGVYAGMPLYPAPGQTVIVGAMADQDQLHGVLHRLSDFGIELISLTQVAVPIRAA